jgi:hypothetical protein
MFLWRNLNIDPFFDDLLPVWLCRVFCNCLVNGMIFGKNVLNEEYVPFGSHYKICLENLLLKKEFREILSLTYVDPRVKFFIFLSNFNQPLSVSTDSNKSFSVTNFTTNYVVGA